MKEGLVGKGEGKAVAAYEGNVCGKRGRSPGQGQKGVGQGRGAQSAAAVGAQ